MTETRKHIIDTILAGGYVMAWKSTRGTKCYRLYDATANPLVNVRQATVKKLDRFIDPKIKIWRKDKLGRMTLNLSMIRKLHGRSYIKKAYKQSKIAK